MKLLALSLSLFGQTVSHIVNLPMRPFQAGIFAALQKSSSLQVYFYLTETLYKVVPQKSILTQIRHLIRHYYRYKE